jgi:excisionase family DNA binding protein
MNTTTQERDHTLVLTVQEAAQRLKSSPWTINKLIRENQLDSIKIGARRLIPADALVRYVDALRQIGGEHEQAR